MPLRRWKRLSAEVVARNPWWTYRLDRCQLPGGGPAEYHYVHTNGSAMVIPVEADGRILLVSQYRYLLDRESLEFPGGGVKEGRTHEDTARAELAEEVGRAAAALEPVGTFNPYNGVTDEMCRVYVAKGLWRREATPDETEEFEVLTLAPEEVDARIRSGEVWDGMTIAAWHLARHRLGPGGL